MKTNNMRLDYFVSQATGLSRKQAGRLIRQGNIKVNGLACRQAATRINADTDIRLQDQPLVLPGERYLMLHKPAGLVCTRLEADEPSVLSLIDTAQLPGLQIVGRLDKDTTGLLLLTTDGQWLHRIISPRRQCPKVYHATLAEAANEQALKQLREGVLLRGENKPCRATRVEKIAEHDIALTLTEGRYHQVKRMLAAVGNRVVHLHRYSIGTLTLDASLQAGEYRHLTDEEIRQFS